MRKALVILLVVVVVAAAGVWAYLNFVAKASEPQQDREEEVVRRGTLTALVNVTGTILPEKQTTLSFRNPGRVAEVLVEEGQQVSSGQMLARLDTTDLDFAVKQAELALAAAQAQLLRLQRPPSEYDIAAAEAALESAEESYERLRAGPAEEEIRVARTSLAQAEAALAQAQAAYDRVADLPNVAMLPQSLQLEQATIAYEAAQASFDLTMRRPSGAELTAARSAIAQAEASLARLQDGVSDEDILLAQIQVEQAQVSLDQAQHQLEGTILTAPHDGVVTLVGIREGELSGGQPAFVLSDLSQYHIDVTVDEIDIGLVQAGQPVTVTVDALAGEFLTGQLDQIAQIAQFDAGVVTYKASIRLDPTDAPLRVGMTANVDIVADRHEGILLVPNRFVRIDRASGQTFVDRLDGEQVRSIEIQIGLRDETFSEVLAGLSEGDAIVLVRQSSREQLRQTFEGG